MKPIAIFRHVHHEGPGYLGEFLDDHDIPWLLIDSDSYQFESAAASTYSGLVFMGGPMSVNDDLPWIAPTLALIRDAVAQDVPVLGHCLGGQLISKALGGVVTASPVKEIGWGEVSVSDNEIARNWFGDIQHFQAFHWHGETFTLPKDAIHLLSSAHCANQAYAIGKHLALQCHPEMTAEMIVDWCTEGAHELSSSRGLTVQSAEEIQLLAEQNLPPLNLVASRLYSQWIKGLKLA